MADNHTLILAIDKLYEALTGFSVIGLCRRKDNDDSGTAENCGKRRINNTKNNKEKLILHQITTNYRMITDKVLLKTQTLPVLQTEWLVLFSLRIN